MPAAQAKSPQQRVMRHIYSLTSHQKLVQATSAAVKGCNGVRMVSVRTEGPTRARQAREAFRCHTDMGCRISWNCSRRMRRSLVTCRTSDPPESVADGRSLILHCGRGSRDLRFLGDPGLSAPAKAVWGPGTEPVACWRGGVWARCSMRETRGPTAVT